MTEPTKIVTLVGRNNCGGTDEEWKACVCTHQRGGCEITPGPLPKGGANVAVPPSGTWLVVDGVARRASVDIQGYAGPQVHLIVTHEPWEDDDHA